jgi:hypothetical protein
MKTNLICAAALAVVASVGPMVAQDEKPVPKDSVRVFIPGCSKGMVFTAGPRTEDQPGRADIPEGTHLRMNGPKKVIAEIKAHEGTVIGITGLMRRGETGPEGVRVGGVRIAPGGSPTPGGSIGFVGSPPPVIDVEGWRFVAGTCRSR